MEYVGVGLLRDIWNGFLLYRIFMKNYMNKLVIISNVYVGKLINL
jgi:hypothetical protein